ncbi:MAG TPA: hypothetical protein VHD87_12375 [Acidimicrobiales bacterium]|nr:hypothetical protein [Acidimicrobiales bacterium]
MTADPDPAPSGDVYEDETVRETLAIEKRLLAAGYGNIPDVLRAGGDFDFHGTTVAEVVDEALKYLVHQQTVDLAGARILATIGEVAVKAQAFDAIVKLARVTR